MEVALATGSLVALVATVVALCLAGSPSVRKAFIGLLAGCFVGAVFVVVFEWVRSGYPSDVNYRVMAVPRFAFQGGVAGGLISLVVIFVVTVWRLITLDRRLDESLNHRTIERKQ